MTSNAKRPAARPAHGLLEQELEVQARELANYKALFAAVFSLSPQAVLLCDMECTAVDGNPAARRLLGLEQAELVGSDLSLHLSAASPGAFAQALAAAREQGEWSGTLSVGGAGGDLIPVGVSMAVADMEPEPMLVVLASDLSAERTREMRLEQERRRAGQLATTLRTLSDSMGRERQDLLDRMARQVEMEVLPQLERMVREAEREVRESHRKVVVSQLAELTRGASRPMDAELASLTPTETEICRYIIAGRTTKEIGDLMNSSFETIQTHRKNIRRKLGIKGERVSLYSHLRSRAIGAEPSGDD